jgi:hypothetical protein
MMNFLATLDVEALIGLVAIVAFNLPLIYKALFEEAK